MIKLTPDNQIDEDGYPTEELLQFIREYDLVKEDVYDLIDILFSNWYHGNYGYELKGAYTDKLFHKRYRTLELHTLGRSGNASIIDALKENELFFDLYWRKTEVGGHYYFRISFKKEKYEV